MPDHIADPVYNPAHYTVYPVQAIEITRHLGFCLGNAVKYTLRAPWKGGVEDCDKALQYLLWEQETPQKALDATAFDAVDNACARLGEFLDQTPGDPLWRDISAVQSIAVGHLQDYLLNLDSGYPRADLFALQSVVRDLRRILVLRDTTGQIYEGMSGFPEQEECGHE
ncbi:DUF3310 domain-containing protein [uncultured Desulfovibrio sp.]|uniref:DUF3310 domain-containing protein n=1 Tax=uncultured Desulfovibrio sp. TaxID=167968 RepID=UPI002711EDB0|nr:DUF3310 domain-containing protein [uncultured Desulfovibrio sp.]